jgi:hypothetical protein
VPLLNQILLSFEKIFFKYLWWSEDLIFRKILIQFQEKAYWLPYVVLIEGRVWSRNLKNLKPMDYFFPESAL